MFRTRQLAQLLIGLFLYGVAISMMVRAGLGVDPWDVLSLGIVKQTGLSFGLLTNVIGAFVLLLWIPLRQRPGLGTVVNVLAVGPSAQLGLALIPAPTTWWGQSLLFAGGLLLLAAASGLYIGARLGPGPRDGLMTGVNARWHVPVWAVRTAVEVTVLAIGWLLGGPVGIGTLVFALAIGPLVGLALPLFRMPERRRPVAAGPEVVNA